MDENFGFNFYKFFLDNRTYHFQAEDESDQRAWLSVLVNCKDTALRRAFDDSGGKTNESSSLWELQQAIIRLVQRLPGNHECCDCNSMNGRYVSYMVKVVLFTNMGLILTQKRTHFKIANRKQNQNQSKRTMA